MDRGWLIAAPEEGRFDGSTFIRSVHQVSRDRSDFGPLVADRASGGRALAAALAGERAPRAVVVGLAPGGVETAAEVARALAAPLDVVVVREIRHPAKSGGDVLGAVTAAGHLFLHVAGGLGEEWLAEVVEEARVEAARLDAFFHSAHPALGLARRPVLIVDDGLAPAAAMMAAVRWARAAKPARIVVAAPLAAAESVRELQGEADDVVCPHPLEHFFPVSAHYASIRPLADDAILGLLDENRRTHGRRATQAALRRRRPRASGTLPGAELPLS